MNLHFGHPGSIQSVSAAVPLYGTKEFESSTRSTIPMLSMLIHDMGKFKAIVNDLGMPSFDKLFLEYKVSPPKGRGKASHTDVMLMADTENVLAIEAKWTEPMYKSVKKWIGKTESQNKSFVLQGWLDLIQRQVTKILVREEFNDAIYQMVHRAASASATGTKPCLAYFLFKSSADSQSAKPKEIKNELTKLWEKLGSPDQFPFYVVQIEMIEREAQKDLRKRKKGKKTSELLRATLQSETQLFSFENYSVVRIGE